MHGAFENWSRTVRRMPARWVRPRSEAAVVDLLSEGDDPLRVCGSRHSWSDVASADSIVQVDLGDLDRVQRLTDDTITVEAGMPLHALCDLLARHGRSLPVVGSILAQTVGGAIATATHGASWAHGPLSDAVVGLTLVDGLGGVHHLGEDHPHLPAARAHLGRLGVVTSVTLRTTPARILREVRDRVPLDTAVDSLHDDAAFVKLWWLPGTREALRFRYHDAAAADPPRPWAEAVDRLANRVAFPALLGLNGLVPAAIPWTNRLVDRVHLVPGTRAGRLHDVLTLTMPPVHRETEWAVPAEHAAAAWDAVRAIVHDRPLDFIVELRPVARSTACAAPSHDQDRVHVGLYAARARCTDACFAELDAWMLRHGGLPHWGKEGAGRAGEVTWAGADAFRAAIAAFDPAGRFAHPTIDAAFGPTAAA